MVPGTYVPRDLCSPIAANSVASSAANSAVSSAANSVASLAANSAASSAANSAANSANWLTVDCLYIQLASLYYFIHS